MMEETTRSRHKKIPPSLIQVTSGSNDLSDNDKAAAAAPTTKTKRGNRKRRRRTTKEQPFHIIVFQVGATLLIVCLASFLLYRQFGLTPSPVEAVYDDDGGGGMASGSGNTNYMAAYDSEQGAKLSSLLQAAHEEEEAKEAAAARIPSPLPTFELSEAAQWDAFGIEQSQLLNTTTTTTHTNNF
jgi:hypothetical protein